MFKKIEFQSARYVGKIGQLKPIWPKVQNMWKWYVNSPSTISHVCIGSGRSRMPRPKVAKDKTGEHEDTLLLNYWSDKHHVINKASRTCDTMSINIARKEAQWTQAIKLSFWLNWIWHMTLPYCHIAQYWCNISVTISLALWHFAGLILIGAKRFG